MLSHIYAVVAMKMISFASTLLLSSLVASWQHHHRYHRNLIFIVRAVMVQHSKHKSGFLVSSFTFFIFFLLFVAKQLLLISLPFNILFWALFSSCFFFHFSFFQFFLFGFSILHLYCVFTCNIFFSFCCCCLSF